MFFLYAGQGSQTVGMGKDFYEECQDYRDLIDSLNGAQHLKELMHNGPLEQLSETANTQPCMSAFAAGVTTVLKNAGITPDGACGLSLGEYGALFAAGVLTAGDYIDLTAFRGRVMSEAGKDCKCSMSAILGMDREVVDEACAQYKGEGFVTVANYNCPGQYVICGDTTAVEQVEEILKSQGARRCVRLNVSGPFHTVYMAPAAEKLGDYLQNIELKKPEIPVTSNYTGQFYKDSDNMKEILVAQVKSSVRMEDNLRTILNSGEREFIEIGPGNALAGFLKKTAKSMGVDIKVSSIGSVEDYKKII